MHQQLWRQAGNPYLLEMLNTMVGPIFMFIASQARMIADWQESLRLHEQLVSAISARNVPEALKSIEAHMRHSLDLALEAFHK
jgi:DNA-binding GntR family transcriptional regulator